MDFRELMLAAGLDVDSCGKYLGVSETTVYRWMKYGAPLTATRALDWCAGYNEHWKGFCFQKGKLITPSGHCLRPVEIDQIQWFNRLHYTNGVERTEERLREKVAANVDISKLALEYLKKEILVTMESFEWDVDRYLGPETSLSVITKKKA